MRRFLLFFCLSLAVGLLLSGCGGGGGPSGPSLTPLTPEQIAQIEAASQRINNVLLQADDPTSPEALEAARQAAQSQPAVEQAAVAGDNLVVKYKDGGFEVWLRDIPKFTPPADIAELEEMTRSILAKARVTRAPVGTRKAVLIQSYYEDPHPANVKVKKVFNTIEDILVAKGFTEVKKLYGNDASIANLKQLSDCSVIVMLGHGGQERGLFVLNLPYCVQTGEAWTWRHDSPYNVDWVAGRVVKANPPWGEGDETTREKNRKDFVAVTGKFWSYYYERSHFKNGLFFNLACSGFRDEGWSQAFRNELFRVGIKGYTGWSETQSSGPSTAWRMLAKMADEKTLQQAYDLLPDSYKQQVWTDDKGRTWEAYFRIGKDDGLNLTLGGPVLQGPQITITSPENGSTTTARIIAVQGNINPWRADGTYDATISVSGQCNALSVDDAGNFSHTVELRAGENIIRVSVITIAESSKEVRVIGDFSSDVLWSHLSWNTDLNDIDLHMVPIEGADGKQDECYFGNKVSSWGAELDVDDVNGYGPEHITARSLPAGKYKLYVHYYATHGQFIPSVVSVAVSANNSQAKVYTLPAMVSRGDIWEVCYITYPAGTIETINKYIPAGLGVRQSFPAKKK